MQCIVLCAGFAARLGALTRCRPKQLLPIGPGCVLDILMQRLCEAGLQKATVVSNHRFIHQFKRWRDHQTSPLEIALLDNGVVSSDHRRGAVGDLHWTLKTMNIMEDFMVLHGDNVFTFSLVPVLKHFERKGNTLVVYDVGNEQRARKAGQVSCNDSGQIISFEEKPAAPKSSRVSVGIYVLRNSIRPLVHRYIGTGRPADRSGDLMAWLHTRTTLFAHAIPAQAGQWFDIGTISDYQEAQKAISQSDAFPA